MEAWEGKLLPRGYTLLLPRGGSPGREMALLIKKRNTFLRDCSEHWSSCCSCHNKPRKDSNHLLSVPASQDPSFDELFEQLPKPFLVLGDFNAHSFGSEDSHQDGRGRMLEEFMAENNLIILNSGEQTFVLSAYHSTSAIDLAVASPSITAKCS
ncbi:RNA-directed DNA polymerase from mobile element jockey [Plakobranchus ocellatus]|uniref:RNA-directed DNA polymerase from mobile element jockey n=1 Tax=Plakobranchus ocellatus TaxID=259542 RepID=A0AAV3ZEY9_9GAST|nr:RNA-directed DNA polymerase from mobile element jockey [Plakobranchus ocellatus]